MFLYRCVIMICVVSTLFTDQIPDNLYSQAMWCLFQTVLVHTPETICLTYFMDLLLQRGKPIMLVGNAGVGKTILVSDKVAKLKEDYMVAKVPFNYYTTSAMLQRKDHGNEKKYFLLFTCWRIEGQKRNVRLCYNLMPKMPWISSHSHC